MEIIVTNQSNVDAIDTEPLREAVRQVVDDSPFSAGAIDVAIVDDAAMQHLNGRYLDHHWPTDVLSFVLEEEGDRLEGQIVASADTAVATAEEFGWTPAEELLLYVIHGALHLVGYRDKSADDAARMRVAEDHYLEQMGVSLPTLNRGGSLAS